MNRLRIAFRSIRRESEQGLGHALTWFVRRLHLRTIRRRWDGLPRATEEDRSRPLTVVIPAVEKDADVLGPCLHSVRRHLVHPLAGIWVVAPESVRLRAIAEDAQAQFVPEDRILPQPASVLRTRGWVLQQLIKFNACRHVTTPEYLVLDADTVFLRPQCFFRGGRAVLRYSDQYELLYNRSLQLVFQHGRRFPASFVTHHQLFSSARVRALLGFLEQRFDRPWWEAIVREVDQGHLISFSEYELYGHFVVAEPGWRRQVALEYWHGLDRQAEDLPTLAELQQAGGRLNSVSFHRHTQ
jgi:hypothetical protein